MPSPITVLVSGANQGLGWCAAQQFAATGAYHVLLACRDVKKGEDAVAKILEETASASASNLEVVHLDIQSDASIDSAVATVGKKFGSLDILINCAGASRGPGKTVREQVSFVMDLNVASHAVVTDKFLPLIEASKHPERRIVFVTSSLGSFYQALHPGPNSYEAVKYPVYRASKAAENMFMLHYAHELKGKKVGVVLVCPGHCATSFNNYQGVEPPENGGEAIVKAATQGVMEDINGKWLSRLGTINW